MGSKKAPNILWICTDSQRHDTLGAYGNRHVRTPHADRLAREGVLFEQCHAQNPLCQPSRASFLTGRYPVTTHVRQNGQDIPETEKLITKTLTEHGYICGLSGKLHLSHINVSRSEQGRQMEEAGIDRNYQVIPGLERRIDDGYTEFHWDHAPKTFYRASSYTQWLAERGERLEVTPREDGSGVLQGMPAELHQTTFCAEKAIGFIERWAGSSNPWLFSVNIFDPHFDFDPPPEYLEAYLDRLDELPLPEYEPGELENKPEWQKRRREAQNLGGYDESSQGDPWKHRMVRAAYYAMCDLIDVQVGRILEALERSGQRENTIVIFTSDHGEMLGDHGIYKKGPLLYEQALHVPLIVSWPGVFAEGKRVSGLVELGQLAPTLLEAAGVGREPGMQMESFYGLLTDRESEQGTQTEVFAEHYNSDPGEAAYLSMVRTETHKLIRAHGTDSGELYDLVNDPGEHRNLWDDPSAVDIKLDLLILLTDRMARTADPLPERLGLF